MLCSYFVNGVCRHGGNCRYSHDLSGSRPSTVCRYYQMGSCSYGSSCRYDHVKPNGPPRAAPPPGAGAAVAAFSTSSSSGKMEAARKLTPLRKGKDYSAVAAAGAVAQASQQQPSIPEPEKPGEARASAPAGHLSYSDAARQAMPEVQDDGQKKFDLCPLAETGNCSDPESCGYMHGLICDMCNLAVLHPDDESQRREHHEACLAAHELSMERAFAAQRSADKQCSVCMEVVVDKVRPSERRFGILSSCTHVFCLACIRKWRLGEDARLDVEAVRSCPECRVVSHYVVPSEYWVETQDEKDKLIADYKNSLKKQHCRYFARGAGQCPFSTSCFYLHAYPDGREAPAVYSAPRHRYNDAAELERVSRVTLWDFLFSAAAGGGSEAPPEDVDQDPDVSAEPADAAPS